MELIAYDCQDALGRPEGVKIYVVNNPQQGGLGLRPRPNHLFGLYGERSSGQAHHIHLPHDLRLEGERHCPYTEGSAPYNLGPASKSKLLAFLPFSWDTYDIFSSWVSVVIKREYK